MRLGLLTAASEAIGGNDNVFELLAADESISVGVVEVKNPAQLVGQRTARQRRDGQNHLLHIHTHWNHIMKHSSATPSSSSRHMSILICISSIPPFLFSFFSFLLSSTFEHRACPLASIHQRYHQIVLVLFNSFFIHCFSFFTNS